VFILHFQLSFTLDQVSIDNAADDMMCSYVVMETQHKTMATVDGNKVRCALPNKKVIPGHTMRTGQ